MTECVGCANIMSEVKSCSRNDWLEFEGDHRSYQTIPYINPATLFDVNDTSCHDCSVQIGAKHHPGCDMERCPRCGAQLISCPCEIVEPYRLKTGEKDEVA